jgi:hypothetical protein
MQQRFWGSMSALWLGVYRLFALYAVTHAFPYDLHESRRSTRVALKVVIANEGGAATWTCDGGTMVVNLQGALIPAGIALNSGMRISIHVYVTDKRTAARVVYFGKIVVRVTTTPCVLCCDSGELGRMSAAPAKVAIS